MKEKRLWHLACYAIVLAGVFTALSLYQRIEEERSRREQYLSVNEDNLYFEISDICRAKSQVDIFFSDSDKRYKIYTADYGSECVYTSSYNLYWLYLHVNSLYQYLSFDMALKDPDNSHLYAKAARPIAQLRDFIASNPDKEDFESHSDDFIEIIENIEPLKEIWEEEDARIGDSNEFMKTVFGRFVKLD